MCTGGVCVGGSRVSMSALTCLHANCFASVEVLAAYCILQLYCRCLLAALLAVYRA